MQFLERVAIAGDVGGQQLGVAADNGRAEEAEHGRTVVKPARPGTSPRPRPVRNRRRYDAALTVSPEISVLFLPSVVPIVEIHTTRYVVGAFAST